MRLLRGDDDDDEKSEGAGCMEGIGDWHGLMML